MPTWPSPRSERLGTPKIPAIRFTRGTSFGASRFTYATACQVARPPLTDRTRSPRPQRAFTSRLPAVWSPSLPLDMTTTWTGLLVLAGLAPAGMAASLAAPDPLRADSAAPLRAGDQDADRRNRPIRDRQTRCAADQAADQSAPLQCRTPRQRWRAVCCTGQAFGSA